MKNLYVLDAQDWFFEAVALHGVKDFLPEAGLADDVLSTDILREQFPYIPLRVRLPDALAAFARQELARLPVVSSDGSGQFFCSLSKNDLS